MHSSPGFWQRAISIVGFCLFAMESIAAPTIVKVDGSSTVFPITEAVAEEFQNKQRGKVRVTVGISGTGGGFKKFCRGETDVQNASRPIQASEIEACRKQGIQFLELPVAYDAIAVVVHPQNTWLKEITIAELKKLWEPDAQGKILKWNQVNPAWPDAPVKLYGAGSDSGTFDYFTEAVMGKAKSSRGDYTASEDDNTLVTGVSNDRNALGYIPYAYLQENSKKLRAVGVVGGDKSPKKSQAVLPAKATVIDGSYFPLARPVFIYVSKNSYERSEVKEFANFYMSEGASLIEQAKYVPLPEKAYVQIRQNMSKGKYGTVFGGHSEVGLKIEDLIKLDAKH